MPLLRKSGVRAPWLPAPLPSPNTNPPRRMSVVPGWQPQPAGGALWFRSVRDEPVNTDPLRSIVVRVGQQPVPGAVIVRLTSVRETPIAFTPWGRHVFPLRADDLRRLARLDTVFSLSADDLTREA